MTAGKHITKDSDFSSMGFSFKKMRMGGTGVSSVIQNPWGMPNLLLTEHLHLHTRRGFGLHTVPVPQGEVVMSTVLV